MMGSVRLKPNSGSSAASALAGAKRRAVGKADGAGSSLTLAQQLGLTPKPAPKLTGDEWADVRERARARGDVLTAASCPICCEDFKGTEQVLLSCSHVFHKVCLLNFEKFAATKAKVCPICRSKGQSSRHTCRGGWGAKNACCTSEAQ